ncbi:hypothetical protein BJ970_007312 [Saccharopolyspora phatthalungensis]|uniref:Uncharacterized protein n=1 Tax=Saccharopolyspora phatthalungensis TaxID=664693 RepID=A0A840QKX0_9PSEU|nr:hypothetical protein [Saccharopolyspora phatthalungensis]
MRATRLPHGKPKDEFDRDVDHWSQGDDKVEDLVNTDTDD